MSWREYLCKNLPGFEELGPESAPLHFFNRKSGEAISALTLYTLAPEYIADPQGICDLLKVCTDAVADYAPGSQGGLAVAQIKSKAIQLAIPERTSPTQWPYLYRAIIYGKENGVSIMITRVRE